MECENPGLPKPTLLNSFPVGPQANLGFQYASGKGSKRAWTNGGRASALLQTQIQISIQQIHCCGFETILIIDIFVFLLESHLIQFYLGPLMLFSRLKM